MQDQSCSVLGIEVSSELVPQRRSEPSHPRAVSQGHGPFLATECDSHGILNEHNSFPRKRRNKIADKWRFVAKYGAIGILPLYLCGPNGMKVEYLIHG